MATSTQDWIEKLKGISGLDIAERIKALREESRTRVEEARKPVKEGMERDEADKLKGELGEGGASVELKWRARRENAQRPAPPHTAGAQNRGPGAHGHRPRPAGPLRRVDS